MLWGVRPGGRWRSSGRDHDDAALDMDRRISVLPEPLRRTLVVEYAKGGRVGEKLAAANMSKSTYYRNLGKARLELTGGKKRAEFP